MELIVASGGEKEFEKIRETVRIASSMNYIGWSDDYDRQFDSSSIWFGLRKEDIYVATCKLIFKNQNGTSATLPIESGDLDSFVIPPPFDGVCEGSGLSLKGMRYILTLMYAMGRWMIDNRVGKVYSIVDVRNERLQRFYREALGFKILQNQFVRFSGFCYKDTCLPVQWQVICLDPEYFHSEQNYKKVEQLGANPIYSGAEPGSSQSA